MGTKGTTRYRIGDQNALHPIYAMWTFSQERDIGYGNREFNLLQR